MAEIVRLQKVDSAVGAQIDTLLKQLDTGKQYSPQALQALIESPSAELWVVKDNERVVGMTTLNFLHRAMGSVGCVDDVVIDEEYRGQGLGKKLMEKVIEAARKRGARHLGLTSRPAREAANKLYQKLGFELKQTNTYRLKL